MGQRANLKVTKKISKGERNMQKRVLSLILFSVLLFYSIPVGAAEKKERMLEDEVMYSIVIDRFFDGDSANNFDTDANNPNTFNGGDFAGITKKLDYLQDMGFTTIILSPIFENEKDGYHGYWIHDFYNTDPHFGTLDEFKKLVKEAHKRDIKVMIDFVANRIGPNHPWLNEADKNEWFDEKKVGTYDSNHKVLETAQLDGLPELKTENSEVKSYLLAVARWWIEETNLDGYRLINMEEVETDFWKDFVQVVKTEKATVYLLGDSFDTDKGTLLSYEETGMDAFMNDDLNDDLRTAFSAPDERVTNLLTRQNEHTSTKLVTFMDTTQLPRFTFEAVKANQHPGTRWKLALSYLYTTPGIPNVLYGTEIALNGGKSPENQPLMNFKTDQDLVEHITKLATLRAAHPALSVGSMEVLYEKDAVLVYKRTVADETMVVVINNSSKTQNITLNQSQLDRNKELRGELNGDLVRSKNDLYSIVIDREQAEIYKLANKSSINIPYLIALFFVLVLFAIFIVLIQKRSKRN